MKVYNVTFCVDVEAESSTKAEAVARDIVNSCMRNAKLGYYTHVRQDKEEN